MVWGREEVSAGLLQYSIIIMPSIVEKYIFGFL
jgi:hypothetical protein